MSRLYDRILRLGFEASQECEAGRRAAEIALAQLPGATVVVADNVADYFFAGAAKDWRSWRYEDLPNVAPALGAAFFEYRLRPAPPDDARGPAAGVLLLADELEPGEPVELFAAPGAGAPDEEWGGAAAVPGPPAVVAEGEARWVVLALVFEDRPDHPAIIVHASYAVEPSGRVAPVKDGARGAVANYHWPQHAREAGMAPERLRAMPHFLTRCRVFPALLAQAFMHCQNVVARDVSPPERLSRKHQKRHGHPLVTYTVLDIDPVREVLQREGESEAAGLKRALHICRGHFAHYPPERPLFGKVTGTFWRPMHVRGTATAGRVLKDYDVLAPDHAPGGGAPNGAGA
jgi:hypothetical protein